MTGDQATHGAELVVQAMLGQDPTPKAIVRALADARLLRTTPAMVYRAEHDTEGLGLYVSREVARELCELSAAVERPGARMAWAPVADADPDGDEYLTADGAATDYCVVRLAVRRSAGEIR
ncbi:hypothetical protein OG401_21155 [Kitasatospora purpeofusca]|uniref:hypothetical protein n=1 Tax=Kitasatospora purpeofusca TaxID=67352 RepID=UPI00225BCF9F|nr:hypothetical protein [Kitasatospora purpeofusca]MCX4686790.1 hypothetical protein [Kitasatospora purpeofusca]